MIKQEFPSNMKQLIGAAMAVIGFGYGVFQFAFGRNRRQLTNSKDLKKSRDSSNEVSFDKEEKKPKLDEVDKNDEEEEGERLCSSPFTDDEEEAKEAAEDSDEMVKAFQAAVAAGKLKDSPPPRIVVCFREEEQLLEEIKTHCISLVDGLGFTCRDIVDLEYKLIFTSNDWGQFFDTWKKLYKLFCEAQVGLVCIRP